jgi:hypothetical protein
VDSGISIRAVLHQDMMKNAGLNSLRLPFSAPQMNPELQGLQRIACNSGIAENAFLWEDHFARRIPSSLKMLLNDKVFWPKSIGR